MALGVLNNLSAIYAENNLNNTNNSLQTVLQQLSSGSRINSGADDAAGLSLVNGLGANSAALTQSETNATEGVGLLQVADGALSQVTSLLNRAITLATEASNGTLNSTQEGAANQEYQSILAEINNIGSTTTYNQQQVFNDSTTAIYTGDSSQAGSSVDDLFIRTLSSSSVGDTGGAMSYSSGQNNVFIDLSKGGTNASASDSLNASGTTTISVSYLSKGSSGTVTPATANITVGTGTNFANTAQGLIDAINNSGLGLSASFGTAAQAGTAAENAAIAANAAGGGDTDTGILISGIGVGTGTNGAGAVGTLTIGAAADTLTGGTLSIVGSDGKTHSLALGTPNSTDTLANLAATINAAGYGVTASVNSSGYLDGHAASTLLTFTSSNPDVSVSGTNLTASAGSLTLTGTPITSGSFTNAIGTITTSNANQAYTGGTLSIGSNAAIQLGTQGKTDNAADLAATINAGNYGVTASVDSTGKILTFKSANASDAFSSTVTVGAGTVSATTNVANQNQIGAVTLTNASATGADVLSGNLVIDGTTFNAAAGAGTLAALAAAISASGLGISATVNQTGVGSNAAGTILTMVSSSPSSLGSTFTNTLADTTNAGVSVVQDTPAVGQSPYYSVGMSGWVTDTTTGGGALNVGMVDDSNGSVGVATTSYSDGAGADLSSSDLISQVNAESTLNELNVAITDVSALDGYIGAQINTLNSISQVMSTQQENIVSAQNAVQATDYASATSNMSKYEILSQTGIAALAQANQVQQEVTKLLQ
ncbi:MAG: flagellin [Terracidiphilus sp.]|jgi:flagellin